MKQIVTFSLIISSLTVCSGLLSITDCGTDYTMAHGQINFIEEKTTYNQTAPVICNIGYEVHGNAEIRCLSNGSWSRNSACRKKGSGI